MADFCDYLLSQVVWCLHSRGHLNLLDPVQFTNNLRFIYHTSRAAAPLLTLGAEVSDGELRSYYLRHRDEESQHDEWFYEDLTAAGIQPFPCPAAASRLAGAAYYHLMHTSAYSLLGYMVVLECFTLPEAQLLELEAAHGKEILRTVRLHCEEDPKHREELLQVISTAPDSEQAVIIKVAVETAQGLADGLFLGASNAS